jgi:hypothetical protein
MSPTSSSSSPSHSSTQTHHPSSGSGVNTRTTILIVVIVSVGILLFAVSVFLMVRFRRRLSSIVTPTADPFPSADPFYSTDPFSSTTHLNLKPTASQGTLITDPSHPAARITPFGSPGGETPRFSAYYVPLTSPIIYPHSFSANRTYLELPDAHCPAAALRCLALR